MGYIRDIKGIKNKEGKTIKDNVLIRSASLDKPTDKQREYLFSIGLKKIIDLRNEGEVKHDPDIEMPGCKYFNISLIDSDLNGVVHAKGVEQLKMLESLPTIEETYVDMISNDYSVSQIRKALREIVLNDEFPTIVHCVTGKDRAGTLIALLLILLDVDYKYVVKDYLKQRKLYLKTARKYFILAFLGSKGNFKLAMKANDYYEVKKDYLDAVINTINNRFTSIDKFFKEYVGLTDENIEVFKNRILE